MTAHFNFTVFKYQQAAERVSEGETDGLSRCKACTWNCYRQL